ncbi:hypothetical protein F5144DRAFT_570634 [Chaetomium tenue]|uniref:Uncharacterized protein n=1 Tax=Chaetomium tenue TaxID=1854479 RepID=A0ACB7P9S1_9PEZI|nr:hypothetical protein F5144DRAFT_570634 [Chaetomium globosum]
MGMAAKELWRDTMAYFNHLLTSALRRSSQALKRKNQKRLARLHQEEEKRHSEFLEWLEAANERMEKIDLGDKRGQL